MLFVKVKKFGVVWYIPFEMTAKSARGGTVRYPPVLIVLKILTMTSGRACKVQIYLFG